MSSREHEAAPVGSAACVDSRSQHLSACFLLLLGIWLLLLCCGYLLEGSNATSHMGPGLRRGLLVALAGGALALAWFRREPLLRMVTSIPFSFALLVWLLLSIVLGTVVLQGAELEEFSARYGSLTRPLLTLGLDDVFHTLWFQAFLGLTCLSLLAVAVRRQAWRVPMWGHLLCHMGVVVILLGGLIGLLWGSEGFIDLHEGQSANEFTRLERGVATGERLPLGFALRLDEFEIERHVPEYRLYAYSGDGSDFRATASLALGELGDFKRVTGTDTEVRVLSVFPDFQVRSELREVEPGRGSPALRLRTQHGDGGHELVLLAGLDGRDRAPLWHDGPPVRLVAEPLSEADLARLARVRPPAHRLRLEDGGAALPAPDGQRSGGSELSVEPGGAYELAGGAWNLRVLEFLPDFVLESTGGEPRSRSALPRNPALKVELRARGEASSRTRWLFAHMPEYGRTHGAGEQDLALTYVHDAGGPPLQREYLVVGSTLEAWEFTGGVPTQHTSFGDGPMRLPGLPDIELEFHSCAVEVATPASASEAWNNPVVQLELRRGGQVHESWLAAQGADPLWLEPGRSALVLAPRSDDVKAYRSQLTVVADGRDQLTKTIAVNDPLSWSGYMFYQSSFKRDDPGYSGILVVRDPGYLVVFAGFAMISLGLIYVYYVRSRVVQRGVRQVLSHD